MTDFTLQQMVLRFCALLLIVGLHGAAVAGAACTLGDQGPRYDGRLRLSPLAHLDLIGLASGVLFSVGWIKPIAIDPKALRLGRLGLVIVVAVAAAALLAIIFALRLVRPILLPHLGDAWSVLIFGLIDTIAQLGIWFAVINLLPIPPLSGSHLVTALIPQVRLIMQRGHIYSALLLMGLAATGLITGTLAPVHRMIAHFILGE